MYEVNAVQLQFIVTAVVVAVCFQQCVFRRKLTL
jgi:hypothetical protein